MEEPSLTTERGGGDREEEELAVQVNRGGRAKPYHRAWRWRQRRRGTCCTGKQRWKSQALPQSVAVETEKKRNLLYR